MTIGETKYDFKCCICGKECNGYGNNPWPVRDSIYDRACDDCNRTVVLPERILGLRKNRGKSADECK